MKKLPLVVAGSLCIAAWAIAPAAARLGSTVALRNVEREWGIHVSIARIGHAGALGLSFDNVEFSVAEMRVATIGRVLTSPALAWPPLALEADDVNVSRAGLDAWSTELHLRGDSWNLGRIAMRRAAQALGPLAWTLRIEQRAFDEAGAVSSGWIRLRCASESDLTVDYVLGDANGTITVHETRDSLTVRTIGSDGALPRADMWRVASPEWSGVIAEPR